MLPDFVTTQYDAIGRLTSTTKPADNGKTATSSTTYNGFTMLPVLASKVLVSK
jgi:hypothetical protein